ncbi:hypothetical protein QA640_30955 [Bradyrhizobium sp. CB82]|uniref:hypothetical protein n=1 Tax=Bradyrhizobium sp. CB82 TaxID=3039159 RepID=UPI0024B149B8|nr:hypothetical protein [Bradyrhizobium sp. CB82]WFU38802.1 hypothetical protein QA640_30955 [Bradyrhizobium sp. CB82]
MTTVRAWRERLKSRTDAFIADRRGAVSFEMVFVYGLMMFSLFLPLADVAIAGFRYISAWEALRGFGQLIQYAPPPNLADPSSVSSWSTSARAKADPSYPIPSIQLICGDSNAVCSSTNTASPKYYLYTTTVTMAPLVLRSVLCTSTNTNPCTFTLSYSERFQ